MYLCHLDPFKLFPKLPSSPELRADTATIMMDVQEGSSPAARVRLNAEWEAKYKLRAKELLASQRPSCSSCFNVCIVGRSGVGKASLVNHLLKQRAAPVSSYTTSSSTCKAEEQTYYFHGLKLKEIPSYDGLHILNKPKSKKKSKGKLLKLEEFAQVYRLFQDETEAIIFVVNNRISPDDQKLIELAIDHRKLVCVVRTHADILMRISNDSSLFKERLKEMEAGLRGDLGLRSSLDVGIFIVCIPWPESKATGLNLEGRDVEQVNENVQSLQFPSLHTYLAEPRGLLDEIKIHGFVKEEVQKALETFTTVSLGYQLLDFSEHVVAGTVLPIAGPIMLSFSKTLVYTFKACADVGLIEDANEAFKKVIARAKFSNVAATKEGLITALHDSLAHVFEDCILSAVISEILLVSFEEMAFDSIPIVGPVISASLVPHQYKKIGGKLASRACMMHKLWIKQNIIDLLKDNVNA